MKSICTIEGNNVKIDSDCLRELICYIETLEGFVDFSIRSRESDVSVFSETDSQVLYRNEGQLAAFNQVRGISRGIFKIKDKLKLELVNESK